MKVTFNQGDLLKIEICEGSGRRIDKFITNIGDIKQELGIIRAIQDKYGVLKGVKFTLQDGESKTILSY